MSTRRTREFFARGAPTREVSHAAIVAAIVHKDLVAFSRDRLWMILTPLALLAFIAIYWLMPPRVDESLVLGVHPPAMAAAVRLAMGVSADAPALTLLPFESEAALAAAIAGDGPEGEGRPVVGISLPLDLLVRARLGQSVSARVYVDAAVPSEVRGAMTSAVREVVATVAGIPLPVSWSADELLVLGTDRAGAQVPLRERMRPMLAFMVLLTESLALAGLVSVEVSQRTATALLATPARTVDVLLAKGIVGTLLAFSQALILLLVTRAFGAEWAVLLVAVLLGAMLMAGIGMLTGAGGRDFLGTIFYGMVFLLVLAVPAVAVLFPGSAGLWVRALPSYGLIQAMVGSSAYGLGFAELGGHLATAALWVVVIFALGWWILGRKLVRL
jgi:ABC-2 type transport system permease protein